METDAHVRAARRREAEDALRFEREREALLGEQLEDVLAETGGGELDADLFARMSPEDVTRVRTALGRLEPADDPDDDDGEDGDSWEPDEPDEDFVDEAGRLHEEIESSRHTQRALERYLELLDEPAAP